ncbi:hypothetical protein RhiLY_12821 [Ceratobasidium sp. AG-Ba]|nr:hypothetical protein RhiLY_12821 [Ceratobasidium sp. AG-Ba]
MTGSVEGPLPPTVLPSGPGSAGLNSPRSTGSSLVPLDAPSLIHNEPNNSDDQSSVFFEADVDRISSDMGARLVVAFVELVMYLKGQVPFPPSTLRMMAAHGRQTSSHQAKLLKSLHSLSEDLPSTLETLDAQQSVTLALVFGLGRTKCFVQLSGADFAKSSGQDESSSNAEQLPSPPQSPNQSRNENPESSTQQPKRRLSSRTPLQEITPASSLTSVDDLSSHMSSVSLKTSVSPEAMIRKAERELAREIATSALADGANLSPAGGQIYMRAPRGFRHPRWVVRQDAAKMLDVPCQAVMSGSSLEGFAGVECVRIRSREAVESREEDEEMIWWGWEGRLAGYA